MLQFLAWAVPSSSSSLLSCAISDLPHVMANCCFIITIFCRCCCLFASINYIMSYFHPCPSISSASSFACCLNYFAISYLICLLLLVSTISSHFRLSHLLAVSIQVHIYFSNSSKPCVSTNSLSDQSIFFFLWLAKSRRFS